MVPSAMPAGLQRDYKALAVLPVSGYGLLLFLR